VDSLSSKAAMYPELHHMMEGVTFAKKVSWDSSATTLVKAGGVRNFTKMVKGLVLCRAVGRFSWIWFSLMRREV
jgi:hypothetical protein